MRLRWRWAKPEDPGLCERGKELDRAFPNRPSRCQNKAEFEIRTLATGQVHRLCWDCHVEGILQVQEMIEKGLL